MQRGVVSSSISWANDRMSTVQSSTVSPMWIFYFSAQSDNVGGKYHVTDVRRIPLEVPDSSWPILANTKYRTSCLVSEPWSCIHHTPHSVCTHNSHQWHVEPDHLERHDTPHSVFTTRVDQWHVGPKHSERHWSLFSNPNGFPLSTRQSSVWVYYLCSTPFHRERSANSKIETDLVDKTVVRVISKRSYTPTKLRDPP